ncbi:MAG: hypothetical protein AAFQ44_08735, partial [Pseudomonadota bacterium]
DVLALMTVRDGSPGEIELLDLGRQIRNRAELAKQQLAPQRAALMSNLRPVDTLMSFAASRSLERFWGGLIVNVSAEFGELGTAGSDVDFAFGYTLNVWFNRFDRVWQQRAARPQDDQGLVPICEGFQFKNINVVAADNTPNRMIATVPERCAGQASSVASRLLPNTKIIPIEDGLRATLLGPARAD